MTKLNVNGTIHELDVDPDTPLLWVLREELQLNGTKYSCGIGECGSCTVHVDGEAVRSCVTTVEDVQGKQITTIEGVADGAKLHPLQEAFVNHGAIQCGFCTPGMVLSAKALLDRKKRPTEHEIRSAISGNLCRCTGYQKIVDAVHAASKHTAGSGR